MAFGRLRDIVWDQLKVAETERANFLARLGLRGTFPMPPNGMRLNIARPRPEASAWIAMIKRVVDSRNASHMATESIFGRLSFAQTSVVGCIGSGLMGPLYAKIRAFPYRPLLSPRDLSALKWRIVPLDRTKSRIETPKTKTYGSRGVHRRGGQVGDYCGGSY